MTITRKPTDGTTPEMVLGNLAATTVLTVWDAATKIGHRARLGTLREWLVARLVPPGTAGRVLVTNGAGGIADGGVTLEELGGGGGGGGPKTVRILNLDDAVPEEHDGILVHTLLAADVNNAVIAPFSADTQALALPGVDAEVGDELDVIYGDPALLVVGDPPYDEPGYLQLGVEPSEDGVHYSVALLGEGPAELSYGQAARLLKTNVVVQGPWTFHLWKVLAISDSGGSGGEYAALYHAYNHGQYGNDPITPSSIGAIAQPYPPPAYGRKALWDGNGGLIDGGADGPAAVPTVLTLGTSPTAHIECASAGQMRGGVGMTVQVTLRLTKPPTADEVCAGNFAAGATTGGWGIGLDATGFKIWVARNSDGVLQSNTPEGVAAFASYGIGSMLGRLYVLRLRVSGTTASLYVNGVLAQSITIAGGLRPADAAGKMMVHRNNSDITPMRAAALSFRCLYYHEAEPAALFYGFEYHHFVETQKLNGTIPLLQEQSPTAARYVMEAGPFYPIYAYNSGTDGSDSLVFAGEGDIGRGTGVVQW